MDGIIERMLRAAKLDASLYEEVERDENSMGQAITVVVISSLAAGIGSMGFGGPLGLLAGTCAALFSWIIWAVLTHFIGTTMLAEPQTSSSIKEVMRVTGFASAPGVIRIFSFIPLVGNLVNFVAGLWMLAAFVVAVRQVLDYSGTGRAILVCVIGFIVQMIIFSLLAFMGLGGAALMATR